MKIYFVRHGHPDYANDCLTELGHKQALAVSEQLENCEIEQVFSSPKGRAIQTAEYTSKLFGINVIECAFMKEIEWGSINEGPILYDGHPWHTIDFLSTQGKDLTDKEWFKKEPYCNNKMVNSVKNLTEGLDAWLLKLGYQREGDYYRVVGKSTNKAVAMFSHGGSSSAALSHLLNIPFPHFCGAFRPELTSITVVELSDNEGELCYPRLLIFNDTRHIDSCSNIFYGV